MGRPHTIRAPIAGAPLALAAMVGLWATAGCEADLNARASPPVSGADQAGQAILAGHYSGIYRVGDSGDEFVLELFADDCGGDITGTIRSPEGEVVALEGAREGSTLNFSFDSEAFAGKVFGRVETIRVLSGTWFEETGTGGTWVAAYIEDSVDDFPCSIAEDFLAATR